MRISDWSSDVCSSDLEGENMLVIHPDECIDCGVCEPECPPEAIVPDTDPQAEAWRELNRDYSDNNWPNINRKGEPPHAAEEHRIEAGKYEQSFHAKPSLGDARPAPRSQQEDTSTE